MPKEYIRVNWSTNRSVITGLALKSLFSELDKISEQASVSKMGLFAFFKEVYYETKIKKSKAHLLKQL